MKHYIIVNPAAGNGKAIKKSKAIYKILLKNNIESTIIISKYEGNITEAIEKFSKKEKCRFYCVGGDGTLNEVVKGIIGTDSEIVVVPAGTGNDFIRSISDYRSIRKIIKSSIGKEASKVDVIKLSSDNYSINILNSGFDATVAYNMNKFRKIPFVSGSFKYNLAIFYTLFSNKNYTFKIRVDDKVYKGKYTLVTIANGKYYGGGIVPSPSAVIDDGMLDICIIDRTSVIDKILLLPKYKKGNHVGLKQVNMIRGKKISIVSNYPFDISLDGQIKKVKYFKCEVLPHKINIVVTRK